MRLVYTCTVKTGAAGTTLKLTFADGFLVDELVLGAEAGVDAVSVRAEDDSHRRRAFLGHLRPGQPLAAVVTQLDRFHVVQPGHEVGGCRVGTASTRLEAEDVDGVRTATASDRQTDRPTDTVNSHSLLDESLVASNTQAGVRRSIMLANFCGRGLVS